MNYSATRSNQQLLHRTLETASEISQWLHTRPHYQPSVSTRSNVST